MDKISFISALITNENKTNFGPKWIRASEFHDGTKNNDYWTLYRPFIDGMSPQLMLKNDGFVEYTDYDESDDSKIFSYEDFMNSEYFT